MLHWSNGQRTFSVQEARTFEPLQATISSFSFFAFASLLIYQSMSKNMELFLMIGSKLRLHGWAQIHNQFTAKCLMLKIEVLGLIKKKNSIFQKLWISKLKLKQEQTKQKKKRKKIKACKWSSLFMYLVLSCETICLIQKNILSFWNMN